jgi:mRNA interferase MazF
MDYTMNRGDVYWVNLDPTTGSEINKLRPCVLVGATPINQARRTVVVVPLSTSATARPPISISVSCLGKQVTAVCDQIRTVDKTRLKSVAGSLSDKDLIALDDGLRQILCL